MLRAITYIGPMPTKIVRFGKKTYEFEWQKALGIGSRLDEVEFVHAKKLSKWRDKKGRKIFRIE